MGAQPCPGKDSPSLEEAPQAVVEEEARGPSPWELEAGTNRVSEEDLAGAAKELAAQLQHWGVLREASRTDWESRRTASAGGAYYSSPA